MVKQSNMETFGPVVSVFLLLFVGIALRTAGILRQPDSHVVNSLIIYATVPALAFGIFYGQRLHWGLAAVVVAGNLCNIASLIIARGVGGLMKLERPRLGGFMMAATFGNTTFMGIPIVEVAFKGDPKAMVAAMMYSELAMSLPVYTLGMWLAAKYGGKSAHFKDVISPKRLPAIPAMALGALLTPLMIPTPITGALQRLGACTLPLAMISVGLMLSGKAFKGNPTPLVIAVVMKLFCFPALMYVILTLFGVDGLIRQTIVLQGAMPNSIIGGVMAARGGADGPFVASCTLITTLASIATIPLVLYALRLIG